MPRGKRKESGPDESVEIKLTLSLKTAKLLRLLHDERLWQYLLKELDKVDNVTCMSHSCLPLVFELKLLIQSEGAMVKFQVLTEIFS